jgi:hypothetical protein
VSAAGVGLAFAEQSRSTAMPCATHAYGQVHTFFTAHPCTSLQRRVLTATGPAGAAVVIAEAEPLAGPVSADVLDGAAQAAIDQPA